MFSDKQELAADLSAGSIGVETIWSHQWSSWSGCATDTVLLYFFYILKNNLYDKNHKLLIVIFLSHRWEKIAEKTKTEQTETIHISYQTLNLVCITRPLKQKYTKAEQFYTAEISVLHTSSPDNYIQLVHNLKCFNNNKTLSFNIIFFSGGHYMKWSDCLCHVT